jgi:hypothetical protein
MHCVRCLMKNVVFADPVQRLNHFDPSDSNHWSQQYFINTTWYRPGGPIFVNIGGEGPASPLDVRCALVPVYTAYTSSSLQVNHYQESNYAQDFGAMLVGRHPSLFTYFFIS